MSVLLANAPRRVMDDAGTEHADGWVLVEDGVVARVGGGERAEADERSRPRRRGRHARPRQHAPPPLPDPHAGAGAGGRPLHVAADALPGLGAASTRSAVYAAARTGLAELALSGCTTVFDHHYVFPRGGERPDRGARCARRASSACGIVASRGSMDLGESRRRPAAGLARRGARRRARRHRAARGAPGRRPRADRRRAVLAVLGHRRADARVGGARAAARARCCTRTSPRPSRRRRTAASSTAARPSSTSSARLARRRRLVRALRPPLGRTTSRASRDRARASRTARRSNLRLGAGVAPGARRCSTRACASGSASTARRRTSAATCFLEVKQALLVARGRGGPTAMTARDALRLGTRGGAAVLRRDDLGSLEPGKRADVAVWRTDGLELAGADDPVAGLVFCGPHRVDRLYVGGEEVVRDGRARPRRRGGDRAEHRRAGGEDSPHDVSTHVLDTERGRPGGRRARRALPRRGARRRRPRPTATGASRELADELEPGAYRLVFHRRRRSSAASSCELELDDGHYHVPLLVSSYGCTTYRGS